MSEPQDTHEEHEANDGKESKVAGVSVRGWLAFMLAGTVCGMSAARINVAEPLYTMAVGAVFWYFGQKTAQPKH